MNENEINERVNFFFENKIMVHVEVDGGMYYNGYLGSLDARELIIQDRKIGNTTILISEIKLIERFRK